MYNNILLAIDLNDEISCRKPLLSAVELARTFGARLHVVSVVREVEAIWEASAVPFGHHIGSGKPDRRPDPACQCLRPQNPTFSSRMVPASMPRF